MIIKGMIIEFNNLYRYKSDKTYLTFYTPTFNRSRCYNRCST